MSLGNGKNEITWSRMNLKEVISELPYPITQSAFEIANKSFFLEQYKKKMGYKLLHEDTEFTKVFYGRLYYNMDITMKMVSDFGLDPKMTKMSYGGFHPTMIENHVKLSIIDRIKIMFSVIKSVYYVTNINKITDNSFKMRNDKYRTDFNKNLKNLTDIEALEYFDSLDELTRNDVTLIIVAGLNYNYWELRKLLKGIADIKNPDDIINQLVTGTNNIISANQALELMRLAGYVKDNGLESELEKKDDEISDPVFKRMLNEFLYKFGHRGLYETCIESPRYYENPEAILKIIKGYVTEGMTSPQDVVSRQKKIREDAIEDILNNKGLSFVKKQQFKQFLNNYTNFMRLREENRYHVVMGITLSRRHVLELGRRFAQRGILEEQKDIFYLTIPEIKKLLSREKIDSKNIVDGRKADRKRNSRYVVPDFFVEKFKPEMVKDNVATELKKVFTGYAASSGIVEGRARIINSPEEFGRFKAGEILVAPATDPMWSTLFPIAKAVVTEMGGVLSHASIVAREYGTPCVVNVQGIIAALEDGDLIEVDGTNGNVKIITDR
ncbi:MAG: PEP-utilizing enzyme [Candidatus Methanoperedens sp.]|nr:PEP-utilizing enzyme [Candidatus Methanoperedens sp.]CAG1007374.1 Prodigiosin synthesizing transferase PigC [Methanosarcinales archaeon]